MFENRKSAGELLARKFLSNEGIGLVLAIPKGGVAIAKPIADKLRLPLGIVYSKKIPTPGAPELASGAEIQNIEKFGITPEVKGKNVILVDDGIATGATVEKAVEYLKKKGTGKISIAVPVAPKDEIKKLRKLVGKVVVLETPISFGAIGEFYRSFPQVSDEEVIQLLQK